MKKKLALFLAFLATAQLFACGDNSVTPPPNSTDVADSTTEPAPDLTYVCELPDDVKFDGETFTFAIYENASVDNHLLSDEETGETINDAKIKRQRMVEDRLGLTIEEMVFTDSLAPIQNSILAADNEFDVATVRCTHALTLWEEAMLTPASKLPYVDIEKGYWNKSFNESLTLAGEQYIAIGDMLTSTLDLTYTLTFNKKLAENYKVGDIYSLVRDGKWTFNQMFSMMKTATSDANGDSKMDENDNYGYSGNVKQVLPAFWIAAGELSVKKDKDDIPYLAIGEESFINTINRVFTACYDDGNYFKADGDDVTADQIKLFTNDHLLFMDASFFYIQQLRSMETDFGIIPYPKSDESQERYYSRVSYYNAPIVPVTNNNLEKTGAVLEYFNYVSHDTVLPAYSDVVLYGKVIRDDESREMLDIIFDSRVVDIGDTTMCSTIRDGVFKNMFKNDDRDISSKIPNIQSAIDEFVEKIPK